MNNFFICIFYLFFVAEHYGIRSIYAYPSGSKPCKDLHFPCHNGNCIDPEKWCDLEDDCGDSTDEIYCQPFNVTDNETFICPPNFFHCLDNSQCIPNVGLCDGSASCDDKSDELDCDGTSLSTPDTTYKTSESLMFPRLIYELEETTEATTSTTTLTTLLEPNPFLDAQSKKKAERRSKSSKTYKDYSELRSEYYKHQREMATNFLISQRKDDFGWGEETPRALIAFLCSNASSTYEAPGVYMLMVKQLDVKLSIALARNETKPIKLTDLALYINAIMSTCRNPRNFYGYDLVSNLRHRVDNEHQANDRHYVSPSVYLTLCINNVSTHLDIEKLNDISLSSEVHMDKIGIQALALLAITCISKHLDPYMQQSGLKHRLLHKIKTEGLPKNVYDISLLIQALNEARVNELKWHRAEAINFLLKRQTSSGSFGDILATYYVLPILSGRSVLSLDEHCSHVNELELSNVLLGDLPDLIPVEVNTKLDKIDVKYSLYHGVPVDLSLTMRLHVARGTNFVDIMRLAQEQNPNYKFRVDDRRKHPLVYSISGIPNDAEKGMFWTLHVISNNSCHLPDTERLVPYHGSIKMLIPEEDDELVFWMKPM